MKIVWLEEVVKAKLLKKRDKLGLKSINELIKRDYLKER